MFQKKCQLSQGARNNFVVRVYSILIMQLATTVAAVSLNIYSTTFYNIQRTYTSLFWINFIISFISLCSLFFSRSLARKYPVNYLILGAYTISQSYLVSYICSIYTPESVFLCACATLSATLGITFYAMTTKSDFTRKLDSFQAVISTAFWIIFSVSMINIFFIRSSFITTAIAAIFGIIFSIYILIDTQLIMGGKNKQISNDDYILGSTILYVDIIQLFLQILKVLGKKKQE